MASEKFKVLMLCDHPLSTSGVGTQSRFLIDSLLKTGKYTFRVFGGAVKHQDYRPVKVNDDFLIQPTDGFGNSTMIRQALAMEKPDVLLLFTDPRFFIWVWEMEDEIHQVCPIAYNHLWDNWPRPEFNKVLYESTDLINCINYPTYEQVSSWFPEKTNYVPHAVPAELYFPMKEEDIKMNKRKFLGEERMDHFVGLYVGRNARRKMVPDIIIAWGQFLDWLEKEHGHRKATLMMHSDPLDKEGTNLFAVVDKFGLKENVIFSKDRVPFEMMNALYNVADVQLNRSCNEGFGLPTLEGAMAGTPLISIVTGGLGRQVRDHITGEEYGVALDPEIQCCVGNQMIPYIFEDFVSHKTFAEAIQKVYELGPEGRADIGKRAIEHTKRDYTIENLTKAWDESLTKLVHDWRRDKCCFKPWDYKEF